jgi:hypothetical protein
MKGDPNDTIDSAAFLLGNKDFWKRTRWICVSGHHYFDSVSKPEDVMGNYGISLDNVGAVRPRKHEEIHGWFYKLSLNNSQYGSFLKFAKYYSDHSFYIEVFGNGETENSLETARREDRYLSVTLAIEDKKLIVPKD